MEAAALELRRGRRLPAGGLVRRALSDERLAERVRAGDDAAFEALYDRHHRQILAFCRHMLGDHAEAEDVLQHVFVAAFRMLRDDERELHLKAWLYAVARNRCLSVLRGRRDAAHELDDEVPSLEGLPAQVQRRADLQQLVADLQRLPDDQRAALVLSELGALSHDDIAEVLGVKPQKVKALVFQAREHLMQRRDARLVPCREIQEQLATLRGGGLRRGEVRRHVEDCPACAAFGAEVRRQRAAMAALLPVIPGATLKAGVLGSAVGGGGAGAALLAGGTGGGLLAGATAALEGVAAKVVVAAAVIGGTGAGGYAAVEGLHRDRPADRPAASSPEGSGDRALRAGGGTLGSVAPLAAAPAPAAARPPAPAAAPPARAERRAAARRERRRAARRRAARRRAARRAPAVVNAPAVAVPVAAPAPAEAAPPARAESRPQQRSQRRIPAGSYRDDDDGDEPRRLAEKKGGPAPTAPVGGGGEDGPAPRSDDDGDEVQRAPAEARSPESDDSHDRDRDRDVTRAPGGDDGDRDGGGGDDGDRDRGDPRG